MRLALHLPRAPRNPVTVPLLLRRKRKPFALQIQATTSSMEMQRKITAREDRLSDLPDAILIHILSMLPGWHNKEVVRTCVLSTRWRFLWQSVPISLDFDFPICESENDNLFYLASIHRELYYWRNCEKIREFRVWRLRYEDRFAKDIDLWVHFAFKVANVEKFVLGVLDTNHKRYEFPQFAYKNASLSYLSLWYCQLNPIGSVNWSSLVSLSLGSLPLTDGVMEKVLSGCPNLECLELESVSGIRRLEISSVKLIKLSIDNYVSENTDLWLEILAPYIQNLQLWGFCIGIRIQQRNVPSLVTAGLHLNFDFGNHDLEKEGNYLKELLHGIAHVENLELGPWCIEFLSVLELKGWQPPPSNWKFLELPALQQLDLPGLCSFLPCSLDLEALVIDWRYNDEEIERDLLSRYTNEDEQIRRFETRNFNCSFPHLKTIEIINFHGPLSETKSLLPLVKYFLKHATVLEKFVIDTIFKESDMLDHFEMTQELLSFPRSSPHASVVFSYR